MDRAVASTDAASCHMAGFTAMDVAVGNRSAPVLRRMEAAAPFAGGMAVKEVKWGGLGTCWPTRHVVVMYRFPGPAAPAADRVVRKVGTKR